MNINAIVCPHCNDTYNMDEAIGLNINSTKCLRCNKPYIPIENKVIMADFSFERVRACKGE